MSRVAQLPPRFPVRNSCHFVNPILLKGDEPVVQPYRASSHDSSFYEEQLSWVGDLLDDCETFTNVPPLRRAVSDPVAMLEESSKLDFSQFSLDDFSSFSSDTNSETNTCGDNNDVSGALESVCLYGPNSPRRMKNLIQPESTVVSAIFESVNHNPFQYVSCNIPSSLDACKSNPKGDNVQSENFDPQQPSRRHTGQRSRVHKLQYIAELERTVNLFQALEADLSAKVAHLFQQRAVLSLENSTLKQKIASVRKEKMIKDGQYQSLKNEMKKWKTSYVRQGKSKSVPFPPKTMGKESSETNWQILDMRRLSLGENPVGLKHGFRS